MFLLMDEEKVFDKNQHPFVIRTINNLGIKRSLFKKHKA